MPIEVMISPEAWASCTNMPSPTFAGVRWIDGTFNCDVSIPAGGNPGNDQYCRALRGHA